MYAKVVIEYPVKSLDKLFTYIVPNDISVFVGSKVLVPFGNQNVNGFVLELSDVCNENVKLKEIISVINEKIVLSDELLKLGAFMQRKTLATRISCLEAMLPKGIKAKRSTSNYDKFEVTLKIKSEIEVKKFLINNKLTVKRNELIEKILISGKILKKDVSTSMYKFLIETNLFIEEKNRIFRITQSGEEKNIHDLTDAQKKVYNEIKLNSNEKYLLFGVTGSGKTEIYLKLIEDVIKSGKTAILLAPEISLTMQIVKRFYDRFKNKVAVFHSSLSDGEKYDEYLKILNGTVSVVVGTRSAIFAPLKNIGIIIIDEEHSDAYKQDNNPRYHARDVAEYRCNYNNCPLVQGSATPLVDSTARAIKGVYKMLNLNERVNNHDMPIISIVDMNKEVRKRNFIFSEALINAINERIKKGEQTMLLLNRRGFSTFVNCSMCGYVYKCPNCDISLTYHKTNNNLMCHYCGYMIKKRDKCPKCGEDALNYLGLGTEQIEEFIKGNINGAKVIRMDQDTTTRKGSHDKIIESFKNKEFNILLGTQMISKGLDFPDVTLVGVINADMSLNIPDYKSNENTFSLLNQVSGRSGRSEKTGEVILQTFNPDNEILNYAKNNDYKNFFINEMRFRKALKYPPYYFLVSLKVISKEYELALGEAKKIVKYLKLNLSEESICLGPTTAALLKYKNNYRFQIIIKYKNDDKLYELLKKLDNHYGINSKVSFEIDFNPNKI